MLKYMKLYTSPVVKNYSSTPPNITCFFSYPTILSSVPTPFINNGRSLSVFCTLFILHSYLSIYVIYKSFVNDNYIADNSEVVYVGF